MSEKRGRIGLTGGIAAGKSTVAEMLASRGALVVDADAIVRELQEPGGPALAGIVEEFGESVLDAAGRLDRAGLGALVFGNPAALQRLNAVVHPLVRAEAQRRIAAVPEGTVVVEDIPLLVETGQTDRFERLIVVQAPHEQRVARMVQDRGMTVEDAEARIAAQAGDEERAAVATDILLNDGSRDDLASQVEAIWSSLG